MKRVIACIVFSAVFFAVSCSYENTATVTIDTGIRKQAQINWFDRVLAFLSFAQPLQADPVPVQLDFINKITLTISASDMTTITQEIPISTGKITLEVPAGSQRIFTVVAGQQIDVDYFYRYYGGIRKVDLSPGQQVNLNIEMGMLPNNISIGYNCNERFVLSYYGNINILYYVMLYYSNDGGETWIFLRKVNKEDFYFEQSCDDWEYDFGGSDMLNYKAIDYDIYGQGNGVVYDYNP